MACNCNKKVARNPTGEALPLVSTEYGLRLGYEREGKCCEDDCSLPSDGSDVPSWLLDTACANDEVTLLARKGNKLTRFTRSGFLQSIKGKISVVTDLSVKAKTFWHQLYRPSGHGNPILGEPLDATYDVVSDMEGNIHVQKGIHDQDSLKLWDKDLQLHVVTPVSELPKTHKGLLPYENELELVGYIPIPDTGSQSDVRQLHVLSGSGIIVFEQVDTIPSDCACEGCTPVPAKASVAKFLSNPTGDGVYTLKYSVDDGHYWEEE